MNPIANEMIWKRKGTLFVQYTTNFDCSEVTNYWYVIKDSPFSLDELKSKYRTSVRSALKKNRVEKIEPKEHCNELYEVYHKAYSKYNMGLVENTKEWFYDLCKKTKMECWASFCTSSGAMTGFIFCSVFDDYVRTTMAKYSPDFIRLRASDALHYYVLDYYLNRMNMKYVMSGMRNINHSTNVQDYEITNWRYRKAFCKLHVIINPKIKTMVLIAYRLRKILKFFDKIPLIHQANSFFKLYEISVMDNKVDCDGHR